MLAVSAFASAAAPLKCPGGTHLGAAEKMQDGGTRESCVDDVTGLAEGPVRESRADGSVVAEGTNHAGKRDGTARLYGDGGVLMGEMLYEKGEFKSMHLSLAGLRMVVDKQNASFLGSGKPYQLSVIDERTLGFDMKVDHDSPSTAEERTRFQDTFRTDPAICRIFSGMSIDVIKLHIENAKGLVLGDFTLNGADCGTAQRPH